MKIAAAPARRRPRPNSIAYCEAPASPSSATPRTTTSDISAPECAKSLREEGLDASALARLARRAEQVEEALVSQTAAAEARLGLIATGACEANRLLAEPTEIVQRLMTAAIARVGGTRSQPHRPGKDRGARCGLAPSVGGRQAVQRQCRRRAGALRRQGVGQRRAGARAAQIG